MIFFNVKIYVRTLKLKSSVTFCKKRKRPFHCISHHKNTLILLSALKVGSINRLTFLSHLNVNKTLRQKFVETTKTYTLLELIRKAIKELSLKVHLRTSKLNE